MLNSDPKTPPTVWYINHYTTTAPHINNCLAFVLQTDKLKIKGVSDVAMVTFLVKEIKTC